MSLSLAKVTRLNYEHQILRRYFPSFAWKTTERSVDLHCALRSNGGRAYTLCVELPGDYPNGVPRLFVTRPRPLPWCYGPDLAEVGSSFEMHTLSPKRGAVSICHFHPDHWGPDQTLYKVIMKGRIWLEAYERHLVTGDPLDLYLPHQR